MSCKGIPVFQSEFTCTLKFSDNENLIAFPCLNRMSVVEKADWKSVVDLFTNAKLVVSSVQEVARKLADYATFKSKKESSGKCSTQL